MDKYPVGRPPAIENCPHCGKVGWVYSGAIQCPDLLDGCEEHQGYYCIFCTRFEQNNGIEGYLVKRK